MPRLRRIEQRDRFFFITTNIAKTVADLRPDERSLILRLLRECRADMGFKIFAYVVMPDHIHMMLEPMANELASVMREFKSKSGLELNKRRQTAGPIWQPRFFDFICRRVRDYGEKVEYVHQNPVTAGLVAKPEDWEWSSAGFFRDRGQSTLTPDLVDFPADTNALLWPAPWR